MIRNYIKIALRSLKKNKNYSLINIIGLTLALTCCILIFFYVFHEISYDRFHKNSDRIYRAVKIDKSSDAHSAITPNPLGPASKKTFPEIKNMVRICGNGPSKKTVCFQNKCLLENNFFLTDPSFFDVFSFPLLKGNPKKALTDPWSVIITEQAAQKYFGDKNPIGKTLTYEDEYQFIVTGILKDIPENSHFRSNFFASIKCADDLNRKGFLNDWTQRSVHTYILLKKEVDSKEFENKLTAYLKNKIAMQSNKSHSAGINISLQPITRIHLHSNLFAELEKNSDIRIVYFYSLIGIIILLIACVNFMNISTARASTRYKEIGMRKVIGAQRKQLIGQFLSESVILSFISLFFAIILAHFCLPFFSKQFGIDFSSFNLISLPLLCGIISITLLVGFISGVYPAFLFSSFRPVNALRGVFMKDKKGMALRSGMVTIQFIISITLIICSLVIFRQVNFLKNKNLGFNKNNVLAVHISNKDRNLKMQYKTLKNELLKKPSILGVTSTSNLPHRNHAAKIFPVGDPAEGKFVHINFMRVDYDFINTLGTKIVEGRFFSKQMPSDQYAFVINEEAVKKLELEKPVGEKIPWIRGRKISVIGVIKNFHFKSLHNKIEPIVLYPQTKGNIDHILVKIQEGKITESIHYIEHTFNKFNPGKPLNYFFIDEDIDRMYKSENKFMHVFGYFTFLAIFIAFLGLFGLSAFNIQQRTKEISIRKVLGASYFNIMTLLSNNLFKLLLIANIFAWPISFFVMHKWLRQFAYKKDTSLIIFIGSTFFAFVIAFFTLGILALKASKSDPVNHLKYE